MNIHPKVTVIIPVYNVAAYLPQCLDSVIAQTLDGIEIICVNDGSKDESLAVLKDYAAKDSRVKIIDKANAGVSAARNDGIAAAKGKYIAFLDGDDFLEPDCLERVYETAVNGNFDTVVFDCYLFDGNHKSVWEDNSFKGCMQSGECQLYDFMSVVWNKLYRTDFLKQNKILFPAGIKTAEDVIFSLQCYFCKPAACCLPNRFYNYRMGREGSVTSDFSCISRDIEAFKYLEKMDIYQRQPEDIKHKVVNKFVVGVEGYIRKFSLAEDKKYMAERMDFISYLKKKYGAATIYKMVYFKEPNLLQKIFSIKNSYDKKYKVITFFGIKFQLKRHKKS